MKKLLEYFKNYHKDYLSFGGFLSVGMYIGVLIFLNYYFNFENDVIDTTRPAINRIPLFLGLNCLAYFGVLAIQKIFRGSSLQISIPVVGYSFLGLLILSIDRSIFTYLSRPLLAQVDQQEYLFWFKVLYNSYGWLTVFTPLLFLKWLLDYSSKEGFYGLSFKTNHLKLYGVLILAVLPVTLTASLTSELGAFYPVYQRCGGAAFSTFHQIPQWISVVVYEFFYLTDFLNTELLFRGFLVIGVSKYLGKDAILPMVAAYAVLHFGKPIGETISSVFGGYLLGVLALYSRNIWGGVLIHTTLAGSMELFAYMFSNA